MKKKRAGKWQTSVRCPYCGAEKAILDEQYHGWKIHLANHSKIEGGNKNGMTWCKREQIFLDQSGGMD